jgi:hypothetical protein
MHHRLALAPWLLVACGLPDAAAGEPPGPWSAEAGLATDLTERGISPWAAQPVARLAVGWTDGQAWSAALAATAPLGGPDSTRGEADAQWALRVTRYAPVGSSDGDTLLHTRLATYAYPGSPWQRFYDHTELAVGATWRDLLWVDVAAVRLNSGGQRATWALEAGGRWPLGQGFSAAGGIGRAELTAWPGWWYSYGDAGLDWQAGPWRASLRAIGLRGARVRQLRGEAADPHASASVGYVF